MLLGEEFGAATAVVMLKRGSSGPAVSALQQKLQAAGFSPGAIDGKFGPGTESAVKSFQRSRGLTADGIVGPLTASALGVALPASTGSSAPLVPVTESSAVVGVDDGGIPWGLVAAGLGGVAALMMLMKRRPTRSNPRRRRKRRRRGADVTRGQAAAKVRAAAAARRAPSSASSSSSSSSASRAAVGKLRTWWQGEPWRRVPWAKVGAGVGLAAAAYFAFSGSSSAERPEASNPDEDDDQAHAERFYKRFHWGRRPTRTKRAKLSPTPRRLVELGSLEAVTYAARKGAEGLVDYVHSFGEEGGKKPTLAADPRSRRLHIVGGDYDVQGRGIVD
jgi:putative peptidoglycan binding protein